MASLTALLGWSATFVEHVPERYVLAVEPDDSHYVNLALAAEARLVVSRDRDLLRLMNTAIPEGREFRGLFPHLEIVDPPTLLRMIEESANL